MQFPAELTREACRTRPRELRLICIYFFTDRFFQVSTTVGPGGTAGIHATSWTLGGDQHLWVQPTVQP